MKKPGEYNSIETFRWQGFEEYIKNFQFYLLDALKNAENLQKIGIVTGR